MSNISKSVTVILVIVAIFLGYKIYGGSDGSSTEQVTSQVPDPVVETGVPSSYVYTNTDVLQTPAADSSDAEKIGFSELVRSQAVKAEILNVSSCKPQPIAISVKGGSLLKLQNDDPVARTISFSGDETYRVEAKSSRWIKIDKQVDMIYAYGCDGSEGPVGMMLVW